MDASRDGIQKLMTAEKEAQAIVSAAREGACAIATRRISRRSGRRRTRMTDWVDGFYT
jgi:hypothetical protein